ncbi:MAG: hypothetical protein NT129_06090 [Candidatus Aenigmarchaeota archaeon]|nr:hypothetical protein [Candidatus Aenigmarchaeota archaeon]
MPAMDVMLVVIVMVVVLVLAILYAMQIKSSGEEQTFNLGGKMTITGPAPDKVIKQVDPVDNNHYTITANDIRFEFESEKEQGFDMVAIADYYDSGGHRQMIYAGEKLNFGLVTPIATENIEKCEPSSGYPNAEYDSLIYPKCAEEPTEVRATCSGRASYSYTEGWNYVVYLTNDNNCGEGIDIYHNSVSGYSQLTDIGGEITVNKGDVIGHVDGCNDNYLFYSLRTIDGRAVDSSFLCSMPKVIHYPADNPVDLVFDFYDNQPPEKNFLHITFWACVRDKNGNCACVDEYMEREDKKLNELIDGCPSFYIGSVDAAPLVTTTTTTTLPPYVTLYNDVNYNGGGTPYSSDVGNIGAGWASSAKVYTGMAGILYSGADYQGAYVVIYADEPDFTDPYICFNDEASSIKVVPAASAPAFRTKCMEQSPCILIPYTGSDIILDHSVITYGDRYWRFTLDNQNTVNIVSTFRCDGILKVGRTQDGSDICNSDSASAGGAETCIATLPAGTYYIKLSCASGCGMTSVRCAIS